MTKSIVTSGGVTTDLQTVGVKVEMDEAIVMLPIWDVPLQTKLGSAPCFETRIDWLEEELTSQVVNCSSIATDQTNSWTIVVDDTSAIRVGDILHADDAALSTTSYEVASVVDSTALALIPAFGATAHDVNPTATVNVSLYRLIGQNLSEGADPKAFRGNDRTNPYNYTQVGQEAVQVSRTERKRQTYGVADEYTHQVQKKFKELAIRMERALTTGVRYQAGSKRTMGGLFSYITTNSRSGVVANTKALINSLVRDAYSQGGSPELLVVSPAVKAAISANVDPTLRRTTGDSVRAGFVVEKILTDFGEIDIAIDRHFPTTKGLLLQTEFDTRRVFDGYFHEMLAKTGDSDKGEIVGEFSLEVKNQNAQGVLTLTDAA